MIQQPGAVSQLSFIVAETASGKKQTYVTEGNVADLDPGEFDVDAVLEGVDILLADGTHVPAELELMRAAKARGITVVLDASTNRAGIGEAVAACDFLVASERFASQFAGVGQLESLCRALLEKGPSTVCVTLGDEGAVAMAEGGEMVRRDAFDVDVVDATGAGDVFHGAVIYGITQSWPVEKWLDFARVAAGLSCLGIGGRSAIPAVDDVLERI
jgi:sugar/nucleoside kinase (ribokinase family)